VIEEAVRFCHEEFGAEPLVSSFDLAGLKFPRAYDLIWAGSLFTHLTPADGRAFLRVLAGALTLRGVLVFSTQGPSCLGQLGGYGRMFQGKAGEFRRQLEADGVAYQQYFHNNANYGIALHAADYPERALAEAAGGAMRRVFYAERGWDEHQDVHGFQRGR
jgi:hypothetical protein